MKLWRRRIFKVYDRFKDVFEEVLEDKLRNLLNNPNYLLDILSAKLPYQVRVAEVREFIDGLDRFRVYSSRHLGRIANLLYRDVREMVDGVFNAEEVEG